MPTLSVSEVIQFAGNKVQSALSVTAEGYLTKEVTVAAAKTGQLTTRTDDNTGTLTMTAGHGITTGARLDVYWATGSRRGMTVGTVATNSVPIDGGAGDVLPTNLTSIKAMVPTEEAFVVTGDNVTGLVLSSDKAGTIVLALSNGTEVTAKSVGGAATAARAYVWTAGRDPVNPLASASVAKVYFSHGDSTGPAAMRAAVLFN